MNDNLQEIKDICEKTIKLQEKMKNSYFWSPRLYAKDRRADEEKNSQDFEFEFNGKKYKFVQHMNSSCKNIYFYSRFYEDENVKDIRLVKRVLREVEKELIKSETPDT